MHNIAGITMSPNEADVVFSSADYNCAGAYAATSDQYCASVRCKARF